LVRLTVRDVIGTVETPFLQIHLRSDDYNISRLLYGADFMHTTIGWEAWLDSALSDSMGERLLERALFEDRPIVAILGQDSGWSTDRSDPVLSTALEKAERVLSGWFDLAAELRDHRTRFRACS
jgi:hypothetical protein